MPLDLPADLQALVQKRMATGAYANAEEVLRNALLAQNAEHLWPESELSELDAKLEHAMAQEQSGAVMNGEAARRRLGARRELHLARP